MPEFNVPLENEPENELSINSTSPNQFDDVPLVIDFKVHERKCSLEMFLCVTVNILPDDLLEIVITPLQLNWFMVAEPKLNQSYQGSTANLHLIPPLEIRDTLARNNALGWRRAVTIEYS